MQKLTLNGIEIEITDEQAKELAEKFIKEEVVRWKPKSGDGYYFIGNRGEPLVTSYSIYSSFDNWNLFSGNCFKTEQDAEDYKSLLIARQKIKDSSDFVPDWSDRNQPKFYVWLDYSDNQLETDYLNHHNDGQIVFYETQQDAEKAIKELEAEYKLHFGVK